MYLSQNCNSCTIAIIPNIAGNIKINSIPQCVDIFRMIWDNNLFNYQEQIYVLFIDKKDRAMMWRCISTGSYKACLVDVRQILKTALNIGAYKIVIAHNHPCGSNHPSEEDIKLTQKVASICSTVDIELLDHIILTHDSYYSFREKTDILN